MNDALTDEEARFVADLNALFANYDGLDDSRIKRLCVSSANRLKYTYEPVYAQ